MFPGPKQQSPMNEDIQGTKLDGWKAIAAYVGVAPRTAQDYERNLGLPVHRLPGQPKSRVVAFSGELDAWKAGPQRPLGSETRQPVKPVSQPPSLSVPFQRLVTTGAVVACIIAAAACWRAKSLKPEN